MNFPQKDLSLHRERSLNESSDASYRIQYHPVEEMIHFAYLPKEIDFPTNTRPNASTNNITTEPTSSHDQGNEGPTQKRVKLK